LLLLAKMVGFRERMLYLSFRFYALKRFEQKESVENQTVRLLPIFSIPHFKPNMALGVEKLILFTVGKERPGATAAQ
jgi:hypothetical protein